MQNNLIDGIAQAYHRASYELQDYHPPRECKNRFGCEKCRHMLSWEELPVLAQNELRSSAQYVVDALEGLGYKIVPTWWLGEVPQHVIKEEICGVRQPTLPEMIAHLEKYADREECSCDPGPPWRRCQPCIAAAFLNEAAVSARELLGELEEKGD